MDYSHVKDQLEEINLRISQTAEKYGRKNDAIKLLAVSKTFPSEAIQAAYDAGHRYFGENRVQELIEKVNFSPPDIEWHLIGHLQSNKAGKAVKVASFIHSVDSVELISKIAKFATEIGKTQKILLEVNISGEESKFGLSDEKSIYECVENAIKLKSIDLIGLMTMAPYMAPEPQLRKIFSSLRILKDKISESFSLKLSELSMGMSGDYEPAIAEGATILRIGTAIFGKRINPNPEAYRYIA